MRTLLVLTPFSVADIFDRRPSGLFATVRISPVQVTIVLEGVVTVLQPRRPALVAACSVGVFVAYSTAEADPIGIETDKILAMDFDKKARRGLSAATVFLLVASTMPNDKASCAEHSNIIQYPIFILRYNVN